MAESIQSTTVLLAQGTAANLVGLLDRREAFSEAAQVLLSSFRKFCQNLKQCIDESPVATRKLLDSAATLVVKLLNR
jgi:hypothetical protein